MDRTVLVLGGAAIAGLLGGIAWWLCNSWEKLIHETAKWARTRNHQGLLRFLVKVENVRASVRQVRIHFLGRTGQPQLEQTPEVARREVDESVLPVEFQRAGAYELKMEM